MQHGDAGIVEALRDNYAFRHLRMPLEESRGFSFDLDLFRDRLSPRTKLVVLTSPQNPTGGITPAEDVARIGGCQVAAAAHGKQRHRREGQGGHRHYDRVHPGHDR